MLQADCCLANDVAGDADRNLADSRRNSIQLIAVHIFHHHEIDFADTTRVQRAHDIAIVEQLIGLPLRQQSQRDQFSVARRSTFAASGLTARS